MNRCPTAGWGSDLAPLFFFSRRGLAERAMYPLVQPGIPPRPLRGVVAQYIGKPPPAERDTHIRQRKLCRAEPALVGIIADAQIELPDAVLMQGGHRSLNDKQTRGTV